MATKTNAALETFAQEDRLFPPPPGVGAQANAKDKATYDRAAKDLEGFWAEQARTLAWRKPFTKVLEWEAPNAKWFTGGALNIAQTSLSRNVKASNANIVTYHRESNTKHTRTITNQHHRDKTQRPANGL